MNIIEKIQEFVQALSKEEVKDFYQIMTAIRGPDYPDGMSSSLKKNYTAPIRGLIFRNKHGVSRMPFVITDSVPLIQKDLEDLDKILRRTRTSKDIRKTLAARSRLRARIHFIQHTQKAIALILELRSC